MTKTEPGSREDRAKTENDGSVAPFKPLHKLGSIGECCEKRRVGGNGPLQRGAGNEALRVLREFRPVGQKFKHQHPAHAGANHNVSR